MNDEHTPSEFFSPGFAQTFDRERITACLNPRQLEAVTYGDGALLVLAGAGSGKTRVITHRIAWLVAQGVHPAEILAITFTNKAAAEMKERLNGLLGPVAQRMWVGTFHAMMLRILRRHAELLGFRPSFTVLDPDDQESLVRRLMKEAGISDRSLTPRQVHADISAAKNRLIWPEDYRREAGHSYIKKQIADIYERYQKALLEQNSMDFDDILIYAVRLLEEQAEVRRSYQERFRHVLVDEYQDTNHAQYRLVRLLAGGWGNLCVVGDDDQSIYSFRGAELQNILDFEHDYKHCNVIKLEQNYRSSANILQAANTVIRDNSRRKDKKLWTEAGAGEKLRFYRAQDQIDEARWIAREIRRLHRGENIPCREIAILYRVNALSRSLESALREEGLPYRIFGGLRFYDRKEIRDTMAYLRLIDSPDDRLAFTRVINTPRRGIGQVTIDRVLAIAEQEGKSPLDILRDASLYPELSHAAGRLKGFALLIGEMRERLTCSELSLAAFVEEVQRRSGLEGEWEERLKQGDPEAEQRLENLRELRSDALEFAERQEEELRVLAELSASYGESDRLRDLFEDAPQGELSLAALNRSYLERASLYSDQDQSADSEVVSLMSIHSAKGLEFNLVFLAGAEEGLFPSYRAQEAEDVMEEERRLAYVAITRAKKRLMVSAARNRLLYGQTRYNMVSRFLRAIPDELVEELGGSRREGGEAPSCAERWDAPAWEFHAPAAVGSSSALKPTAPRRQENPFLRFARSESKTATDDVNGKERLMALPLGTRLHHARFGSGTLVKKEEVGGDAILSVDFGGEIKHMMAGMAKLEIES